MPTTRLFVISDLHLGGADPAMCSRPGVLADWIRGLPARLAPDERLELLIAGDAVDFLAMPPGESFTADPVAAVAKLEAAMRGQPRAVFEALGAHCAAGHGLTIMVGNHDVELVFPAVQDALRRALGADDRVLRFSDDGSAWRLGGVLVEHGNRYDGANVNDWTALRALASLQSRGEEGGEAVTTSAGSELVARVVNPIKARYPLIDLLEPQGAATALLLLAFEPGLLRDLKHIGHLLQAGMASMAWTWSGAAWRTRNVSAVAGNRVGLSPEVEARLASDFAEGFAALAPSDRSVGASDWLSLFLTQKKDSLSALLEGKAPVPPDRLRRVQSALVAVNAEQGRALHLDGPGGALGDAAQRLLGRSIGGQTVQVVLMGHTHQPRHHGPADRATYLNTGTWSDTIRIPDAVLDETPEGLLALEDWLHKLFHDQGVRELHPTWADLRVEANGNVASARLVQDAPL